MTVISMSVCFTMSDVKTPGDPLKRVVWGITRNPERVGLEGRRL